MAKFNNVLVTGYRQQQEQEKKQNELKSKHHIDDPNVVVVEKATWQSSRSKQLQLL